MLKLMELLFSEIEQKRQREMQHISGVEINLVSQVAMVILIIQVLIITRLMYSVITVLQMLTALLLLEKVLLQQLCISIVSVNGIRNGQTVYSL